MPAPPSPRFESLSLSLVRGERLALVGASGAGKSTIAGTASLTRSRRRLAMQSKPSRYPSDSENGTVSGQLCATISGLRIQVQTMRGFSHVLAAAGLADFVRTLPDRSRYDAWRRRVSDFLAARRGVWRWRGFCCAIRHFGCSMNRPKGLDGDTARDVLQRLQGRCRADPSSSPRISGGRR